MRLERLKHRKALAKICVCEHSLRASWLQERVPLHPAGLEAESHLAELAGHLAESMVGHYLAAVPPDGLWRPICPAGHARGRPVCTRPAVRLPCARHAAVAALTHAV